METNVQKKTLMEIDAALDRLGRGEAVSCFLNSYGNLRTQKAYSTHLANCFGWLEEIKGVTLSPSELPRDILSSIYRSEPEDVASKRKPRGWLEEYVNVVMVREGFADMSRLVLASAVRGFYEKNDSPLYGKLTASKQAIVPPAKPLSSEDIRLVLKTLPIQTRARLLVMWQSGCEVNRVLSFRWRDVEGVDQGEYPLKLQFYGRKRRGSS